MVVGRKLAGMRETEGLHALAGLTVYLQQILFALNGNHLYFTTGTVPTDKVLSLTEKFVRKYPTITASPAARSNAKLQLDVPVVRLFWMPLKPRGSWEFTLMSNRNLADEGMRRVRRRDSGKPGGGERKLRQSMVVFQGYYQLALNSRGGWTWEMSHRHYQHWQKKLHWAVGSGQPERVSAVMKDMTVRPSLYHGVRRQVLTLFADTDRRCFLSGLKDVEFISAENVPIARFRKVRSGVSLAEQVKAIERETEELLQGEEAAARCRPIPKPGLPPGRKPRQGG